MAVDRIEYRFALPRSQACRFARASRHLARASDPVARVSDPVARVSDPVARASDPVARASDPVTRASDPVARVSDPVSRASHPVARASDHVARADISDWQIQSGWVRKAASDDKHVPRGRAGRKRAWRTASFRPARSCSTTPRLHLPRAEVGAHDPVLRLLQLHDDAGPREQYRPRSDHTRRARNSAACRLLRVSHVSPTTPRASKKQDDSCSRRCNA